MRLLLRFSKFLSCSSVISVPQDLLVYEMHRFCQKQNPGAELRRVMTYGEHSSDASLSGGTIATATFQIGKDRTTSGKDEFDPMLTNVGISNPFLFDLNIPGISNSSSTHACSGTRAFVIRFLVCISW